MKFTKKRQRELFGVAVGDTGWRWYDWFHAPIRDKVVEIRILSLPHPRIVFASGAIIPSFKVFRTKRALMEARSR